MSDRTLVLLKPDSVERGLVGAILSRFENKGLRIAAMELRTLDAAIIHHSSTNNTAVTENQPSPVFMKRLRARVGLFEYRAKAIH